MVASVESTPDQNSQWSSHENYKRSSGGCDAQTSQCYSHESEHPVLGRACCESDESFGLACARSDPTLAFTPQLAPPHIRYKLEKTSSTARKNQRCTRTDRKSHSARQTAATEVQNTTRKVCGKHTGTGHVNGGMRCGALKSWVPHVRPPHVPAIAPAPKATVISKPDQIAPNMHSGRAASHSTSQSTVTQDSGRATLQGSVTQKCLHAMSPRPLMRVGSSRSKVWTPRVTVTSSFMPPSLATALGTKNRGNAPVQAKPEATSLSNPSSIECATLQTDLACEAVPSDPVGHLFTGSDTIISASLQSKEVYSDHVKQGHPFEASSMPPEISASKGDFQQHQDLCVHGSCTLHQGTEEAVKGIAQQTASGVERGKDQRPVGNQHSNLKVSCAAPDCPGTSTSNQTGNKGSTDTTELREILESPAATACVTLENPDLHRKPQGEASLSPPSPTHLTCDGVNTDMPSTCLPCPIHQISCKKHLLGSCICDEGNTKSHGFSAGGITDSCTLSVAKEDTEVAHQEWSPSCGAEGATCKLHCTLPEPAPDQGRPHQNCSSQDRGMANSSGFSSENSEPCITAEALPRAPHIDGVKLAEPRKGSSTARQVLAVEVSEHSVLPQQPVAMAESVTESGDVAGSGSRTGCSAVGLKPGEGERAAKLSTSPDSIGQSAVRLSAMKGTEPSSVTSSMSGIRQVAAGSTTLQGTEPGDVSTSANNFVRCPVGCKPIELAQPDNNVCCMRLEEKIWGDPGLEMRGSVLAKEKQCIGKDSKGNIGPSMIIDEGRCLRQLRHSERHTARGTDLVAASLHGETVRGSKHMHVSSIHLLYKDWCDSVQLRHRRGISGPMNLEKGTFLRTALDGSLLVQRLEAQRMAEPHKLWLDHLDLLKCCKIEVRMLM
jgi:hypothetical protein